MKASVTRKELQKHRALYAQGVAYLDQQIVSGNQQLEKAKNDRIATLAVVQFIDKQIASLEPKQENTEGTEAPK